MKLQMFLSHNGVCSRREALQSIKEGSVRVNGNVVTEPSVEVDPEKDKISFEGQRVRPRAYVYVLLNKPRGYVTTKTDKHAPQTVLDLLPKNLQHVSPVGRLDKDTEGLLLLTNDGAIAHRLTHPRYDTDKVYFVRLEGKLELKDRLRVQKGVYLSEGKTSPAKIQLKKVDKKTTDLLITVHEGKKRQIRRVFAKVGHKVIYLKRISQGPLTLGRLKIGEYRILGKKDIEQLKKV